MASIDMSRPSLDRAHQHTTFYLPAENLSQNFSSFSSGRLDAKKKQDAQQSSDFQFRPRDALSNGWNAPGSQEPAVAPQPASSSLTTSLKEARNAEQGVGRNTNCRTPLDLSSCPAETAATDEGSFYSEISELEDYQDPANSSNFASPSCSSDASDFADCESEANSLTSSQEDEMEDAVKKMRSHPNGPSTISPWAQKLEEEQEKRKAAERAAVKLRQEHAQLELELQLLKQQARSQARAKEAPAPQAILDESAEVVVARTVSSIFARVVAGAEVAQQWQGEVELLQKRMARMARMEEAIERQRQRERAAMDTLQRRLMRGALAVGCIGAGAFAAYMAVRWLQSPARSVQLELTGLPDALSEAVLSDAKSHRSDESSHAGALAAPALPDPLPDVSRSYVSTIDLPLSEMMSTAEILQRTDAQARAEGVSGVHLAGMGQGSVMGAGSALERRSSLAALACSVSAVLSRLY